MTYLELCQKLRQECGIQGSGPTSVTGNSGLQAKLVNWIADANDEICAMWFDWAFLWTELEETTVADSEEITKPSDLGVYDRDSFYLDYSTDDYQKLTEIDYAAWRRVYRQGTKTSDMPSFFAIAPNRNIILEPPPDDEYTLTAHYWKTATRLSANADNTLVPTRFQRIIIARAKMYFAEHENAPEVLQGAMMEYNSLLMNLEASQLPGMAPRRVSSNNLQVIPE